MKAGASMQPWLRSLVIAGLLAGSTTLWRSYRRAQHTQKAASPSASAVTPAAEAPAPKPPADLEPLHWERPSANGKGLLVQSAEAPERCTLRYLDAATREERWSRPECLARVDSDAVFLSPDGEAVIVLHTRLRTGTRWNMEPAGFIWRLRGHRSDLLLGAFIRDMRDLRSAGLDTLWLRGTGGLLGLPPRYDERGGVAFDTPNGDRYLLRFDTLVAERVDVPALVPATAQARKEESGQGLYRYEDDEGTVHYVEGLDAVPILYRKRAERSNSADLQVVPATPPVQQATAQTPPPRDGGTPLLHQMQVVPQPQQVRVITIPAQPTRPAIPELPRPPITGYRGPVPQVGEPYRPGRIAPPVIISDQTTPSVEDNMPGPTLSADPRNAQVPWYRRRNPQVAPAPHF